MLIPQSVSIILRGAGAEAERILSQKSQNNCGSIIVTLRPEDGEITLGAQNTR